MADERGGVIFIMKKMLFIIPITFFALLLLIGLGNQTCLADPIDGSGYSILVIEGIDDDNHLTTLQIQELSGSDGELYYSTNGGTSWTQIPISYTIGPFSGGTTLDFKLDFNPGTNLYSFNTGDATITYWGNEFNSTDAETPNTWWTDVYYKIATIDWDVGGYHFNICSTTDVKDGLISAVPIPTSVLLLGAGLLGLIGIGYRRRKSTAE